MWLALDSCSRQVIAFHVGDRSAQSAEQLWQQIPAVYRQQATFYTDCSSAYASVIPAKQHQAITKKSPKTNHVERFNGTMRQRISRLVRSTLSFSKNLVNPIGAIKYFIGGYNLEVSN
jgi:insertion element IS1 protein InsB